MNLIKKKNFALLIERGDQYYDKLDGLDSDLPYHNPFSLLKNDSDNIRLERISLDIEGGDLFNDNFEIRIKFEKYECYGGCGCDWSECSITLPEWILEETDVFESKLTARYEFFMKRKRDLEFSQKQDDLKKLQQLAKELNYEITKKGN